MHADHPRKWVIFARRFTLYSRNVKKPARKFVVEEESEFQAAESSGSSFRPFYEWIPDRFAIPKFEVRLVRLRFTRDIGQLRGVQIFDNLVETFSFDLLPEDAPVIQHI